MKFVCDRCQTKYSIADDKVRGKILKVRCKTCSNVVTVREPSTVRPSVPSMSPVREAARSVAAPASAAARGAHGADASGAARPGSGSFTNLDELSEHTTIAAIPPGLFGPTPPPVVRKAPTAARPPVGDPGGVAWFVSLDGHQDGGALSQEKLVDRLMALPRDADVHVWNERMDGWKEPGEVPELAREIAARRRPAPPPPPARPSLPPPPAPPVGIPRGASGSQSMGGPLSASTRLPRPSVRATPLAASAATASAAALDIDLDPSSMLETPGPKTHPVAHPTTHSIPGKAANGAGSGVHAATPLMPMSQAESDALNALNIGKLGQALSERSGAHLSGSSPRQAPAGTPALGVGAAWAGPVPLPEARHRSGKYILGLLGIVAVVCVVMFFSIKKPAPPADSGRRATPTGEGDFAALAAKAAQEKGEVTPPPPVIQPVAPPPAPTAEVRTKTVGGKARGGRPGARGAAPAPAGAAPSTPPSADEASAARFREAAPSRMPSLPSSGSSARGAPSQADITRVISNNRAGIKTCYQRALLRDSSLTHGKIAVHLNVGISGRVKAVTVDGPPAFRALEPCIREVVLRWFFPTSSEGYETEFSYVFQGNE